MALWFLGDGSQYGRKAGLEVSDAGGELRWDSGFATCSNHRKKPRGTTFRFVLAPSVSKCLFWGYVILSRDRGIAPEPDTELSHRSRSCHPNQKAERVMVQGGEQSITSTLSST